MCSALVNKNRPAEVGGGRRRYVGDCNQGGYSSPEGGQMVVTVTELAIFGGDQLG